MLQLYLHQLIRKNIQQNLKLSYSNYIKENEFDTEIGIINKHFKPSIADVMQTLSIVYNIGHFYNTFTASRAAILFTDEDNTFKKMLLQASYESRYKETVIMLLEEKNYQRFHLINS